MSDSHSLSKETTFTPQLGEDELETILAIAKNEQTGRITPSEIRELVRGYCLAGELYEALNRALSTLRSVERDTHYGLHDEWAEVCTCSLCNGAKVLAKARGEDRSHEGK